MVPRFKLMDVPIEKSIQALFNNSRTLCSILLFFFSFAFIIQTIFLNSKFREREMERERRRKESKKKYARCWLIRSNGQRLSRNQIRAERECQLIGFTQNADGRIVAVVQSLGRKMGKDSKRAFAHAPAIKMYCSSSRPWHTSWVCVCV